MPDDILEHLRQRLPTLFARAVAGLQERAAGGDAGARHRLDEIGHAPWVGFVRVVGEGAGDLVMVNDGHVLSVASGPAAAVAFGHALALPAQAARHGLALLGQSGAEIAAFARAWAGLVSPTARGLLAATAYGFELAITRIPVLGDLRVTISLGRPSLPARPEFTLTIDYDELEDARELNLGPHQLFMAGKVRIDGDVAKAMMLGMTLAQLR